jgi:1-acyl-sn-glycerol-3-phosphate acyltransferase
MKLHYRIGKMLIWWTWHTLFGLKVEGGENVPTNGGVIIAPNHLSYYDPPLLGAALGVRELFYFAKQELFQINKFITWLLRTYNAFEVKREGVDRKAIKYAENLLSKGFALAFFPEGTRSKGDEFLPPHPGLGYLALKAHAPVVPVLIQGTNKPLWKLFWNHKELYVKIGKPLNQDWITREISKKNSSELSQEVMRRIKEMKEAESCK